MASTRLCKNSSHQHVRRFVMLMHFLFASSAANGGADSAGYSLLKSCRLEELESRDFEDGGAGGEKTAFSLRSFFT